MKLIEIAAGRLETLRKAVPLVHCITNYVTVNDVANVLLAIGGSPIMADEAEEVEDIVALSSALVLNMGTLNRRTIGSMLAAGKRANELGVPVVFDPVGAGASDLRNRTARELLSQVKLTVLRGNLSELSFVAGLSASTRGVDSSLADQDKDGAQVARAVARQYGCVAAVTGAVDFLSDGERLAAVHNGHPMLSRVTGTGCMTTALVGAMAGAGGDPLAAAVGGVCCMGIAGELAYGRAGTTGTGSFRTALIDALSLLDGESFRKRAKIDEK